MEEDEGTYILGMEEGDEEGPTQLTQLRNTSRSLSQIHISPLDI